jgi:hypothetical protein
VNRLRVLKVGREHEQYAMEAARDNARKASKKVRKQTETASYGAQKRTCIVLNAFVRCNSFLWHRINGIYMYCKNRKMIPRPHLLFLPRSDFPAGTVNRSNQPFSQSHKGMSNTGGKKHNQHHSLHLHCQPLSASIFSTVFLKRTMLSAICTSLYMVLQTMLTR